MTVDRCICRNVPFHMLLQRVKEARLPSQTPEQIAELLNWAQDSTGLGTGCGMCVPYAMVALRTGRVRVPVMTDAQRERVTPVLHAPGQ